MFDQPKLMIVGQINISDIKGAKAEATTKVISLIRERKKRTNAMKDIILLRRKRQPHTSAMTNIID